MIAKIPPTVRKWVGLVVVAIVVPGGSIIVLSVLLNEHRMRKNNAADNSQTNQ